MTDYTTPDEASQASRDYRNGYYAGKEYAEFQAGVQMDGLRKTIADLKHERDNLQRHYHNVVLKLTCDLAYKQALVDDLGERLTALDEVPF